MSNNSQSQSKGIQQPGKTYDLKAFHIMIVEDYEFMQQLTAGMLKAFGVGQLTVCNSGDEAKGLLQILQASRSSDMPMVDIIITDWMMPDGSGLELMQWVRNHKTDIIKFLPMILVSAFASEDIVKGGRDNGANEVLVKPLSGDKLASRILSVIDKPRPFIKSPDFFGPDRRRRNLTWKKEERRKLSAEEIETHNEQL